MIAFVVSLAMAAPSPALVAERAIAAAGKKAAERILIVDHAAPALHAFVAFESPKNPQELAALASIAASFNGPVLKILESHAVVPLSAPVRSQGRWLFGFRGNAAQTPGAMRAFWQALDAVVESGLDEQDADMGLRRARTETLAQGSTGWIRGLEATEPAAVRSAAKQVVDRERRTVVILGPAAVGWMHSVAEAIDRDVELMHAPE